MSKTAVIRLIPTLSGPEKRYFKLAAKRQSGNKDYLRLFDLIDSRGPLNVSQLEKQFHTLRCSQSLNNVARYLLRVLTDCLVRYRMEKDQLSRFLHGLQRVKILMERSLPEEGYRELKKLGDIAAASRNHLFQYLIYRYELDYLGSMNFPALSYQQLVETQMKAKDALKNVHYTQEHHSLYELLKYRLAHMGRSLSAADKQQLNDLVLSELSLATGKGRSNLAARKLHLLFQSYFLTHIGDYKSALKTFHELNRLFEEHPGLLDHPPLDYLSALEGILDSLRTIGSFDKIPFYIDIVQQLDTTAYPEYFRYQVRRTVAVYKLAFYIGAGNYEQAAAYIPSFAPDLMQACNRTDDERQWELYFYCSLACFKKLDLKKAHQYISHIMQENGLHHQSVIYKATRLLNIVIHYERKDMEYLAYAARSYKRSSPPHHKLLKCEKLVFKTIQLHPQSNGIEKNKLLWKKLAPYLAAIKSDKYEGQLLKYFDFAGWAASKFSKEEFA